MEMKCLKLWDIYRNDSEMYHYLNLLPNHTVSSRSWQLILKMIPMPIQQLSDCQVTITVLYFQCAKLKQNVSSPVCLLTRILVEFILKPIFNA